MGARKGQNNFQASQREKVKNGKLRIKLAIEKIKKKRLFNSVDELVVEVADKSGLHRTTVRRNPEYFNLVLKRFTQQPGVADRVGDDEANAPILRIKLFTARTEIGRLTKEIENLKRHQQYIQTGQTLNHPLLAEGSEAAQPPSDIAFANTAMCLLMLLERLEQMEIGISLDYQKQQIIDISEMGEKRLIAGPSRTKWFFEWLTTHEVLKPFTASK
jgi:hypothetical protein